MFWGDKQKTWRHFLAFLHSADVHGKKKKPGHMHMGLKSCLINALNRGKMFMKQVGKKNPLTEFSYNKTPRKKFILKDAEMEWIILRSWSVHYGRCIGRFQDVENLQAGRGGVRAGVDGGRVHFHEIFQN